MKGKAAGFCVMLIGFVGVCFLLKPYFAHHSRPTMNPVSEETLVAPALIDSLNDVTQISTLQSGVLKHMAVTVGQIVKKGETLFTLDSSLVENNVHIQTIMLEQAKNQLDMQQKKMTHDKAQLDRLRSLDPRAISQSDLQDKIYEVNTNKAQLIQAQRQLALSKANLKQAKLVLEQFTVTAPKEGVVLQINIKNNEFVGASQPILLLADAHQVMVRVSMDERDIQRFHSTAPAYLTSNEDKTLKIPLTFLRLNQYIVTQERFNSSHVQEVIYYFSRKDYANIIAGQQLDANIMTKSHA